MRTSPTYQNYCVLYAANDRRTHNEITLKLFNHTQGMFYFDTLKLIRPFIIISIVLMAGFILLIIFCVRKNREAKSDSESSSSYSSASTISLPPLHRHTIENPNEVKDEVTEWVENQITSNTNVDNSPVYQNELRKSRKSIVRGLRLPSIKHDEALRRKLRLKLKLSDEFKKQNANDTTLTTAQEGKSRGTSKTAKRRDNKRHRNKGLDQDTERHGSRKHRSPRDKRDRGNEQKQSVSSKSRSRERRKEDKKSVNPESTYHESRNDDKKARSPESIKSHKGTDNHESSSIVRSKRDNEPDYEHYD